MQRRSCKVTASWKLPWPFSVRFVKKDAARGNPFRTAWGEGLKIEDCRAESRCQSPRDFRALGSFALCQITTQHQQGSVTAPAPPSMSTCLWDIRGHTIWTKDHLKTETPNGKPRGPAATPLLHEHIRVAIWPVHVWNISGSLQEPPPLPAILNESPANQSNTQLLTEMWTAGVLRSWDSGLCFPLFSACQFWGE